VAATLMPMPCWSPGTRCAHTGPLSCWALALRLGAAEPGGAAAGGPVDEVLAAERRARLLAAVNTLPDNERQVLVCRYFLELSEAETAQVLAWPLGSVKSRTWRALNRLRGLLVPGEQSRISHG